MLSLWVGLYFSAYAVDTNEVMTTAIYPVLFGDPVALQDIGKSIVGDDGHVVLDQKGSRLIVVTTPSKHVQLNSIFGQMETPIENVRIDVQFRGIERSSDTGISLQGKAGVVVTPGRTDGIITLHPEVRHTTTEASSHTIQSLLVASGREGSLRVGERVPYIEWITEFGWHNGYLEEHIHWQEAGSFLVVKPVVMGNGEIISIQLTPELRGLVDDQPYRTRFAAVSTTIMARNGESVSIGGLSEDREFYSKFLVGFDRSGVQQSLDIILTPRIIRPPALSK